jgi:hypothetical protein
MPADKRKNNVMISSVKLFLAMFIQFYTPLPFVLFVSSLFFLLYFYPRLIRDYP